MEDGTLDKNKTVAHDILQNAARGIDLYSIVMFLLNSGADVTALDSEKRSLLHYVAL